MTTDPTAVLDPAADAAGAVAVPAGGPVGASTRDGRFTVRLKNFEGPFDLLLQLISKHQMDVTEVALHQVTDDFIAHIRAMGDDWDLDQASEFLLVAATLLDLKAARLLPSADVEDEEDLALLEARDLLFARLLQYKAFKHVAAFLAAQEKDAALRSPRSVTLEAQFAAAMPEVLLGIGPEEFARLAAQALAPKPIPQVSLDHLHTPKVSVREHAAVLRELLARLGTATFGRLCEGCVSTLERVARFLALLELYREGVLGFEQDVPLGELHVRWIGGSGPAGGLQIDEYGDADDFIVGTDGPAGDPDPADGSDAASGERIGDVGTMTGARSE